MTPEEKDERKRWRTESEALQKRIKEGTIGSYEAQSEQKRLDEWYQDWEKRVIGHDGLSNGSV